MSSDFSLRTFSKNESLVQRRREHIVKFAAKIFCKQGYDRSNMREIAEACEMSVGSLYHYFGSKEEILYAILNSATSEQQKYLKRLADGLNTTTATKALTELFRKYCQWHNDNQDITIFTYQETKNLPENARRDIFDSERRIISIFEEVLKRGVESGEFVEEDVTLMAHNIAIIAHSWAFRRWFFRNTPKSDFETYVKHQASIILNAIRQDRRAIVDSGTRGG